MAKKGENIYKRKDGRWEGRYIKKRTNEGKIRYGYIYGKKYSEVKERLVVQKAKYAKGKKLQNIYYGHFSDWVVFWRDKYLIRNVKPTTFSVYSGIIKNYLIPYFGSKRLTQIENGMIQTFIDELEDLKLSSGYIRNVFHILKICLNEAEKRDYISHHSCKGIILPKAKTSSVNAITIKDQRKLETVALESKNHLPVILALYSGMRIGEISGLKWTDIDFDKEVIHVRRTVYRISRAGAEKEKTKLVEGTPKTESSQRVIPLSKNLKSYLLEEWNTASCEYVVSDKGKLVEPRVINYRFKRLLQQAELENIHFHSLRHTFATRCLENGADITSLSRLLGHNSVKMTLDTYTDSMLENRRAAIAAVDGLFTHSEKDSIDLKNQKEVKSIENISIVKSQNYN